MTHIEKRIDGTLKRIEKIHSKIARLKGLIEKKRIKIASGKEENNKYQNGKYFLEGEIEWHEEDIKRAERDLVCEEKKLKQYQDKQKEEIKKAPKTKADVFEVLDRFLANWKIEAFKYFVDLLERVKKQEEVQYDITKENLEFLTEFTYNNKRRYSDERIAEFLEELESGEMAEYKIRNLKSEIRYQKFEFWKRRFSKTDLIIVEKMRSYGEDSEKGNAILNKILDREVAVKRASFISKIEKVVDEILDFSGIRIGVDGSLNGIVIGSKNNASVKTVYAGGYNIQCLHYRVLVKKLIKH